MGRKPQECGIVAARYLKKMAQSTVLRDHERDDCQLTIEFSNVEITGDLKRAVQVKWK